MRRKPGRRLTTGKFDTRESLEWWVIHYRVAGLSDPAIGRIVGVSASTVAKITGRKI